MGTVNRRLNGPFSIPRRFLEGKRLRARKPLLTMSFRVPSHRWARQSGGHPPPEQGTQALPLGPTARPTGLQVRARHQLSLCPRRTERLDTGPCASRSAGSVWSARSSLLSGKKGNQDRKSGANTPRHRRERAFYLSHKSFRWTVLRMTSRCTRNHVGKE